VCTSTCICVRIYIYASQISFNIHGKCRKQTGRNRELTQDWTGTRTHDETTLGTTLNRSYQNFLHGCMMTEMNVTVGDSEVLRNSSSPYMYIILLYRSSRDRISSASAAKSINLPFLLAALQYKQKRKKEVDK